MFFCIQTNPRRKIFMKKRYLLASIIVITALIVSCTAAPAEKETITEATPAVAAIEAPVAEPVAEPIVEPVAQVTAEEAVEADTEVISSAPAVSPFSEDLDQKFSYVYGHLLANSIVEQGIVLNPRFFNSGSSDFFNFVEPQITEEKINEAFNEYQSYIDGLISDEELRAGSDEASEVPVSLLDRFSYGYGYLIMFNLQSQGIIVSLPDYNNGVTDSLAGIELPYTEQQIDELFSAYQERMIAEYNTAIEQMGANNLAMAEEFLTANAENPDVVTTASGLQYQVITQGTGDIPAISDSVVVDYMMTFLDGSVGDSSYSRGEPSEFPLSNLIPGFVEGLRLMQEGSYYRFFIHPELAYGEMGNESIPPNSLLVFDVELYEIVK
jgi:FKBP-type peptidyl-prolyl cis-trans isomerase FkpA